ncbi:MAG: thioredoxin family protein [Myxococcales bacterium]|nr:thioredoxin family protein [Myxococcales bacterium]
MTRFGIALALALLGSSAVAHGAPLFAHGRALSSALDEARARGRRVLVKVSATWCAPCRALKRDLERSPAARAALGRYVRVAFDAEHGEGVGVAKRYNVITFPTVLLLDSAGREVGRVSRVAAAKKLLSQLARLEDGSATLAALEKRAARRGADLVSHARLCRGYSLRGDVRRAVRHCQAVVRGDAGNARGLAAKAMLDLGRFLYLRSARDSRRAKQTLRALRRRFAKSREATQAIFPLARALHRLGQRRAARALLDRWATSAATHNAAAWFAIAERTPSRWAITHARRAVALAPKDADHHEALARLLALAGRHAAARAQWRKATTLRPKSAYYRRMLANARPR